MNTLPTTARAPFYMTGTMRLILFVFLLLAAPEYIFSQPLLLNKDSEKPTESERDKEFQRIIDDLISRRNSGDMAAPVYLGDNYLRWNRNKEDIETGIFYLEEAAGYGFAEAQSMLGYVYLKGVHVERDPKKAAQLFIAAAQQGKADALRVLAEMHLSGDGVDSDKDIAASYFKRAAELGDRYSAYQYARSLIWGAEESSNKELGVLLLTDLAERQYSRAGFLLSNLYLNGKHVPYNPSIAQKWLTQAAKNGSLPAKILELQINYGKEDSSEKKTLIREKQTELAGSLKNKEKNEIAWAMATHSYQPFRDGEFSVWVMEGMLDSEGQLPPAYLDTLAAAYAATGNFEDAVKTQSQAIEMIEVRSSEPVAKGFFDRLALYENKKQYIQ
ncbi:tetratricopeptide repeat protein [Microbulbifer bruguierae]|uniref:Tetratricopeptide repeat protein n=1 Tax=Microbulbifer bruguierae TaxID=3029061 RepID=A0ABY8NB27_9GAMM|nr:tetratricopeptide repeat protein [Microbulbifer bruguierae]WGL15880.1 tetratricopeptide repeat protein [Microbulbifer bruguierae]